MLDCVGGQPFGPKAALLGALADGPLKWMDPVTENPSVGATELWEIHNFTEDAHPIHVHLVRYEVINREDAMADLERICNHGESVCECIKICLFHGLTRNFLTPIFQRKTSTFLAPDSTTVA